MILALFKTLLVRHFFVKWALVFSYAVTCSCNIIFCRVDYLFVMHINYVFDVWPAVVAYFNNVFIEQLVKFVWCRRKYLLINFRNWFATFVKTFLLYEEWNQIIFLLRYLVSSFLLLIGYHIRIFYHIRVFYHIRIF